MGCAAMLAGFTRQTYSLAVIMLETTQQINFFIPILLTILVSVSVGKIFNQSLYERALRGKNIPLLRNHVPPSQEEVTAYQIMTPLVLTIEGIVSVEYLVDILQKPFSQYPVINSAGNVVGMMPKSFLIILLENHHWLDQTKLTPQ
jgi:CBS domain-containing protein